MNRTLRWLTVFVSLVTASIACTRSEVAFPTQEDAVPTQVPNSPQPTVEVQPISTVETGEEPGLPYPNNTKARATILQEELAAVGVETELQKLGNGDLVLTHTDSRGETEIGTFRQQGSELVFVVTKTNGKPAYFPVEQVKVDPETEHLTIVDEEGNTLFAYIQQVGRLNQYADLPYLTETVGRLTVAIGDSFDRSDDYGFNSLTVGYRDSSTAGFDPMLIREFRDPGTGQTVELDSAERLSLATEIAQVIAAQAWDPNYTFTDLREGEHHQIRTLDGEMHEVDPTKGMTFYLTGSQPSEKYYTYEGFGGQRWKFWWEADDQGGLTVFIAVNPTDPVFGQVWNIDLHLRQSLLTMMIHQYADPNSRFSVPYGSSGYRYILPSSSDRGLVKLLISLVQELDQEKLQELRSQLRPGQEVDYEFATDNDIDLLWAER